MQTMSDPTLSDIDFKNKMALVWTTVEEIFFSTIRDIPDTGVCHYQRPLHRKLSQVKNAKDNDTNSRGEFVTKKKSINKIFTFINAV